MSTEGGRNSTVLELGLAVALIYLVAGILLTAGLAKLRPQPEFDQTLRDLGLRSSVRHLTRTLLPVAECLSGMALLVWPGLSGGRGFS